MGNPFVANSPATPLIAGMAGGAEAYGLLKQTAGLDSNGNALALRADLETLFSTADLDRILNLNTPSDAVVALLRLDLGPIGFVDNYANFDMLLVINLTDVALANPRLGVNQAAQALRTGGFLVDPAFGGSGGINGGSTGWYRILPALNPHAVWATLVPTGTTTTTVSASITGATPISGQAIINNQVLYVTTSGARPPSPVVNALSGLDAIAVSPLGIADTVSSLAGTVDSTLHVDSALTIADLDVSLDITHTKDDNLDVFLINPSGTQVELFTDVGGSANNFIGTILDDGAATSITAGSAPFTGRFQPEGLLSAFNGNSSAGTWTLRITDDTNGDVGTLDGWSLTITDTTGLVHRFVASPSHVYGVNVEQDALVVINADAGSQRQLFKDGDSVLNVSNNPVTLDGLAGASDVSVSPDGKHLYVASPLTGKISIFQRDLQTGNLTFFGTGPNVTPGIESIVVSDDGTTVYANSTFSLLRYTRNPASGALTFTRAAVGSAPGALAVSHSGSLLYVVGEGADNLRVVRTSDFSVRQVLTGTGLDGASAVAVSADDQFVYVTARNSNSITVFKRAPGTDQLTLVQTLENGVNGVRGLVGASDVSLTLDGKYAVVSGAESNALAVFQIPDANTGRLQFAQLLRNNVGGTEGLVAPSSLAISVNGSKLLAGSGLGLVQFDNVALGVDLPEPISFLNEFDAIAALGVSLAGGDDNLILRKAPESEVLAVTLSTGEGGDIVVLQDLNLKLGIPDLGTVESKLRVDSALTIADLDVSLDITHTFDADLDVFLISPSGTQVELFTDVGSGGDNFIGTTLDDEAATSITAGSAPFTGRFRPEGSLAAFDGQSSAGTWTLRIIDDAGADVGTLNGWSLTITASDGSVQRIENATTIVNLGAGNDEAQLRSGRAGTSVVINGDAGADQIVVNFTAPSARTVINGGADRDVVRVTGPGLDPTSTTIAHGDNPNPTPRINGDTLLFDPQGQTISPSSPSPTDGTLRVTTPSAKGLLTYDTFEGVQIIAPPIISFASTPGPIREGQSVTITINVSPLGTLLPNQLEEPVQWDIDGDGRFGEVVGGTLFESPTTSETLTLAWDQLVDLGLNDDGAFQIGVSATNDQGTSEAFTTLTINNTPPDVTVRGEDQPDLARPDVVGQGLVGQPYQIFFAADDPGDDRVREWRVVWDANKPSEFEVFGSGTISATHAYNALGTFTIHAFAVDEDFNAATDFVLGGAFSGQHQVAIDVTGDQVSAGGPYSISEGQSLVLEGSATGADLGLVTGFSWDINGDGTFGDAVGASPTVSWATLQSLPGILIRDDGTFNVSVRVTYQGGSQVISTPTTLTVTNTTPTFTLNPVVAVDEDGIATLSGTISDPSADDTFFMVIDWGDTNFDLIDLTGPPDNASFDSATRTFTVTHRFVDDNPTNTAADNYAISVFVLDDDGPGYASASTNVTVSNVAPTVTLDPITAIDEHGIATLTGTVSDVGRQDTFTLTVNWGDPLSADNVQTFTLPASEPGSQTFTLTHRYLDDNPTSTSQDTYNINVVVTDDDSGVGSDSETVLVENTAPQLQNLSATTIDEDGITRLTGNILDAGSLDTFTLDVEWGDGTVESLALEAGATKFLATHRYLDDNPTGTRFDNIPIEVTLTDDDGGSAGSAQTSVRVNDLAPTVVDLGLPIAVIPENGFATLIGRIEDTGTLDNFTLNIDWGEPRSRLNTEIIDLTGSSPHVTFDATTRIFTVRHQYLDDNPAAIPPDTYTIEVTATDDDGLSGSARTTVHVNNTPPVLVLEVDPVLATDENGLVTVRGTITDPGTLDTFTLDIDWGDPLSPGNIETIDLTAPSAHVTWDAVTREYTVTHQYLDDNPSGDPSNEYSIVLEVTDNSFESNFAGATVRVDNGAPTIGLDAVASILENGTATLSGTITDPGTLDTFTLDIDWGDPLSPGNIETIDLTAPPAHVTWDAVTREYTVTHQYLDDSPTATSADPYTIQVRVTDDDTGQGRAVVTTLVSNVAPHNVIINDEVSTYVFAVGESKTFAGSFADVGTLDTHTAVWTIEHKDHLLGTIITETRTGTVDPVTRMVSDSLSFREAGLYRVTLMITDDDTGATTSEVSDFVVYDPSAGFITGGGHIPASDSNGKANFGFVSKYHKGAEVPKGQTQFKVGNLNFHSSSYDWMVVSGAWVQIKGTGTVNGGGNYGFLLTMIDGPDTLRMKIWDTNRGGAVVFDTQPNAHDEAEPTTPLRGGQITLHGGETGAGTGKGNGNGRKLTAGEAPQASGMTAPSLTDETLAPIVAEAMRRWSDSSLLDEHSLGLGVVTFEIVDLEGLTLGEAVGGAVLIDPTAAGYGWFVDLTPTDDSEFGRQVGATALQATAASAAFGHVDLLSAVIHELGHVLGFEHADAGSRDVMDATLPAGIRRLPGPTAAQPAPGEAAVILAPDSAPVTREPFPTEEDWAFLFGNGVPGKKRISLSAVGDDSRETPPLAPRIDWSGTFVASADRMAEWSRGGTGTSGWVRSFLLALAAAEENPNQAIRIELPAEVSAAAQALSSH